MISEHSRKFRREPARVHMILPYSRHKRGKKHLHLLNFSSGPVLFQPGHLSYTIFPPQIVYRTGACSVQPANGELTAREAK